MANKPHDVTPEAMVKFARNLYVFLAKKFDGDTTLNLADALQEEFRRIDVLLPADHPQKTMGCLEVLLVERDLTGRLPSDERRAAPQVPA